MRTADVDMPGGVTLQLDYPDDATDEQINASINQLQQQGHLQDLYNQAFKQRAGQRIGKLELGFPLQAGPGENRFASPGFTNQAIQEAGFTQTGPQQITAKEAVAGPALTALASGGTPGAALIGAEKGSLGTYVSLAGSLSNIAERATGVHALGGLGRAAEEYQRVEEGLLNQASVAAGSTGNTEAKAFIGELAGGFLSGAGEGKLVNMIAGKLAPSLMARLATKTGLGHGALAGMAPVAPFEAAKAATVAFGYPVGATEEQKRERMTAGLQMGALGLAGAAAFGAARAHGIASGKPPALVDEIRARTEPATEQAVAETPSLNVQKAGNEVLADIVGQARKALEQKAAVGEGLAAHAEDVLKNAPQEAEMIVNEKLTAFSAKQENVRKAAADLDAAQAEIFRLSGIKPFEPSASTWSVWRFMEDLKSAVESPLLKDKQTAVPAMRESFKRTEGPPGSFERQIKEAFDRLPDDIKKLPGTLQAMDAARNEFRAWKAGANKEIMGEAMKAGQIGGLADAFSSMLEGSVKKMMSTDPGFRRLMDEYAWHLRQPTKTPRAAEIANNILKVMGHEIGGDIEPKYTESFMDILDSTTKQVYEGVPDEMIQPSKSANPLPVIPSVAESRRVITFPELEKMKIEVMDKVRTAATAKNIAIRDYLIEAAAMADHIGIKFDPEKFMDFDFKLKPEDFEGKVKADVNERFGQALKAQFYWAQRAETNARAAADLALKESALRVGAPLEGKAPPEVILPRGIGLGRQERLRMRDLSKAMTPDERLAFQVAVRQAATTVDYRRILAEMEKMDLKVSGKSEMGPGQRQVLDAVNRAAAGTGSGADVVAQKTVALTDKLTQNAKQSPGRISDINPEEVNRIVVPPDPSTIGERLQRSMRNIGTRLKLNFGPQFLSPEEAMASARAGKAGGAIDFSRSQTQEFLRRMQTPELGVTKEDAKVAYMAFDPVGAEAIHTINQERLAKGLPPAVGQKFFDFVGQVGAFMRDMGNEVKKAGLWDEEAAMKHVFMPRILNGTPRQLETLYSAVTQKGRVGGYGWDSPRMFQSLLEMAEKQGVRVRTYDIREVTAHYIDAVAASMETRKLIDWAVDRGAVLSNDEFKKGYAAGTLKGEDWKPLQDGRYMKRETYVPMSGFVGPMGELGRFGSEIMGLRNVRFSGDFNIPLQLFRALAMHPLGLFDAGLWSRAFERNPQKLAEYMQDLQKEGASIGMGGQHYERPISDRHSYIESTWSKGLNGIWHGMKKLAGKSSEHEILSMNEVDILGQAQLSYVAPGFKRMLYEMEYQRAMKLKEAGDKFFGPMEPSEINAYLVSKIEPSMMNGKLNLAGLSPRTQDYFRLILGAPSWNLGILKGMAGAAEEISGMVRKGTWSNNYHVRNVFAQLTATFVAAQAANQLLSWIRDGKVYKPDFKSGMDPFMVDLGIPDKSRGNEKKNLGLNLLGPNFRFYQSALNAAAVSMAKDTTGRGPVDTVMMKVSPFTSEAGRRTKGLLNPAFQPIVTAFQGRSLVPGWEQTAESSEGMARDVLPVSWSTLADYSVDHYMPTAAVVNLFAESFGVGRVGSGVNQTLLNEYYTAKSAIDATTKSMRKAVDNGHPEIAAAKANDLKKYLDEFRQTYEHSDYWEILRPRYASLVKQVERSVR